MDYHFDLKHDKENFLHENKVLFNLQFGAHLNTGLWCSIIAIVLLVVDLSSTELDLIAARYATGAAMAMGMIYLYSYFKVSKQFKENIKEISLTYDEHPDYTVFINEEYFGGNDYYGDRKYRWTDKSRLRVKGDVMIIDQFSSNAHAIVLTEAEVGVEEFEQVLKDVKQRVANIEDNNNPTEIEDNEILDQ